MVLECWYCGTTKLTMLNATCYCPECEIYFRIENNELSPIFIENKLIYRQPIKLEEKKILCALCEERGEREYLQRRAEADLKIDITGNEKTKTKEPDNLCLTCIEKVNEVLKQEERKLYRPYRLHLLKKGLETVLSFGVVLGLSFGLQSKLLDILSLGWLQRSANKNRLGGWWKYFLLLLVFPLPVYFYLHWAGLFYSALKQCRPKRTTYLKPPAGIVRVENKVLSGFQQIKISQTPPLAPVSPKPPAPPLLPVITPSEAKIDAELDQLCHKLSTLKIKLPWYRVQFNRLMHWAIN
ncbi:hypothetical protein NEHOM01_0447 [Nematocida homosporus]|uniref:uncharacterized protein n=1 Tax=Nematocida homosporus TaxID=1912981 RepID=UPI00221F0DEC|nr:uncharacterized protein NEHOM01_0447 [Nematocida homosporus]KAI5184896.1 hypothetical protein NEHOM01_0447 [Nematocida homosporus]